MASSVVGQPVIFLKLWSRRWGGVCFRMSVLLSRLPQFPTRSLMYHLFSDCLHEWMREFKYAKLLASSWECWGAVSLPSWEPHLSTPTLSSDSCLTSVCSWQWVCFRGLEICQVVFGLRVIHLSYFGLLCIHSFKEGSGSLLRGHYVTCMMLSLGDWRGTVSAFIINLEPLRLFYFPP